MNVDDLDPNSSDFEGDELLTCLVENHLGVREKVTMPRTHWAYLKWLEDYRHFSADDFIKQSGKRFAEYPLTKILQCCVAELIYNREREGFLNPPWIGAVESLPDWWVENTKERNA